MRGAQFHIVKNHNGTHYTYNRTHNVRITLNMLNTWDGSFIAPSGLWSYLAFILWKEVHISYSCFLFHFP